MIAGPSSSPLVSQNIQGPLSSLPCKHNHASESPPSPRYPMIPPKRFRAASSSVSSRTTWKFATRSAPIISFGTVGEKFCSGQSIFVGAQITVLPLDLLLIGCAEQALLMAATTATAHTIQFIVRSPCHAEPFSRGLKPEFPSAGLAARLKPCPFKTIGFLAVRYTPFSHRLGLRFCCKTFLRSRSDLGVTSTTSSSAMNSIACSRLRFL